MDDFSKELVNEMAHSGKTNLKQRVKIVAKVAWSQIKKIIMPYVYGALGIIFLLIVLIAIILTLAGYQSENGNNHSSGTYNGLKSYSFWWPIGSQDITSGEDGEEYAIGDPSAISISSDYKDRNSGRPDHNGIDISSVDINGVRQGYNYHYIIAAKDGTVITSHLSDTAGEYIAIDHGDGFVTKYMHMHSGSRIVNVGDVVKQGQILGKMGNTGSVSPIPTAENPSAGTHLHFQIELNGVVVDPLQYVSAENPRSFVGNIIGDTNRLTRSEFISKVENFGPKKDLSYYQKMAEDAGTFYDVCTSKGVNPEFAFAHACLETGYGQYLSAAHNYFGYNANTDNVANATAYETSEASIEEYCDWIIRHLDVSTAAYQEDVRRAEEFSKCRSELVGTPETNIYVLFIQYSQITTHYSSESRNAIKGMYGEMCSHSDSEPITTQEHADYAVYTTDLRLQIMHNIFGE